MNTAIQQRLQAISGRGIRPGFETLAEILDDLGSPHRRLASVLVGGTNGKGSTANLLASMATAAGYRVGLFTSPHLQHFEEQLRVDGQSIAPSRLLDLWDRVVAAAEARHPGAITAFEVLTACAFLYFDEQDVDLVVCEVGMGGRLDSTNILDPALSIVTALGVDHQAFLGPTLSDIAAHKAGIFRPGRPALVARSEPLSGEELLVAHAQRVGARPLQVRHGVEIVDVRELGPARQRVRLRTGQATYDLQLPLAGPHQVDNLATAVRGAEELQTLGWDLLDVPSISRGVANSRWPGRLESLTVKGRTVLLDAAHNPQGAAALAAHLDRLDGPFELLFGALADKDATSMLGALRKARRLWLTRPDSPRAWDPHAFEPPHPWPTTCPIEAPLDLPQALRRALDEGTGRLVVTGSLRLVGDTRSILFDLSQPTHGGHHPAETVHPTHDSEVANER